MPYASTQPEQTRIGAGLEHPNDAADLWGLEEDPDNPILWLDSPARIAFLLHHLFGHKIEEAALLVEISEKEFRTQLRSAYRQLAPFQFGAHACFSATEEPAEA
jgi:hypothetical protein